MFSIVQASPFSHRGVLFPCLVQDVCAIAGVPPPLGIALAASPAPGAAPRPPIAGTFASITPSVGFHNARTPEYTSAALAATVVRLPAGIATGAAVTSGATS